MTSNDGRPVLPSVHISNVHKHIDSLEQLKQLAERTLLLSHGNAISGKAEVLRAIACRQQCLQNLASHAGKISIEAALAGCQCDFLHQLRLCLGVNPGLADLAPIKCLHRSQNALVILIPYTRL